MNKKWLAAMLGAAAMAVSAGAIAQRSMPGWYAGLEVGQADFGTEDDTAIKILGGYQFNRNFAAEVGYGMLLDKGPVEVTALELVGVGSYPINNQFSLFGKLGFANVEVEVGSLSDDKTELTYGFGVHYSFTPQVGLRGQWQRYDTNEEVDVLSIGILYRF